jgi:hypothetical protein
LPSLSSRASGSAGNTRHPNFVSDQCLRSGACYHDATQRYLRGMKLRLPTFNFTTIRRLLLMAAGRVGVFGYFMALVLLNGFERVTKTKGQTAVVQHLRLCLLILGRKRLIVSNGSPAFNG